MMRRPHLKKILVTLLLVGIAAPALASLIYTWEDLDGTGATGMIEFANDVTFYDEFDANPDLLAFSFNTPLGQSFDESFAFDALFGVDVGAEFLCFNCTSKKVAKKKTKEAVELIFAPTERAIKKQKGATEVELRSFMDWFVTPVAKKKTKSEAGEIIEDEPIALFAETGFGRWARVSVPEPSALLLVFTGLGILSLFRRRVARR